MPNNACSLDVMVVFFSCLSHSFCCHVVCFDEQWAFVVWYDFDTNRIVPCFRLDTLADEVWIGRLRCRCLVKVLDVGCVGQEKNVLTVRQLAHYFNHKC